MLHLQARLPAFALALGLGLLGGPSVLAQPYVERPIILTYPDTWDVAVADFNGDGLADVAAVNSHGPFFFECTVPPPAPIECGPQMLFSVALNHGLGQMSPGAPMHANRLPLAPAAVPVHR